MSSVPVDQPERGLGSTLVLALGTFAVGTDAYVVAGFLPGMAHTLGVSQAAAGQSAAVFAVTYAVLAPLLAAVTAHVPRRPLLVAALLLLAAANCGSALAPNYPVLIATRMLAAAGAAAFTPGAGAAAVSLVSAAHRGRALAVVVGGLTVATALGVPLGNLVGRLVGWRTALGLVAAVCAIAAACVRSVLPELPGAPRVGIRLRLDALRRPGVLAVLPLTVLGLAASYGLYAYAVPILQALGADGGAQTAMLFLYGAGAVVGNLLAGAAVDRRGPIPVLMTGYLALALTLAVAGWAVGVGLNTLWLTGLLMLAWGAATWVQTPAQQVRLINAAPDHTAVVVGLNASALYLGIAAGTAVGGPLLALDLPTALAAYAGLAGASLAYLALTRSHR